MRLNIDVPEDLEPYLVSSARLRRTTLHKLMRKVVHAVLRDQMILAVLDDADGVSPEPKSYVDMARQEARVVKRRLDEQPYSRKKAREELEASRVVERRPNAQTFSRKKAQPKTRGDLRREFEQAAANTAAMTVE